MNRIFCLIFLASSLLTSGYCQQKTSPKPGSGRIVQIDNFASMYVDSINVSIWLPDGYDGVKKHAVLYMQDGQMLFDTSITWNKQEWGVDETVSALIRSGDIRPTIVVGIWNRGRKRFVDYFPQKVFESLSDSTAASFDVILREASRSVISDAYLKFIVEELKPFIDKKYVTHSNKANTVIGGSSMGALISMYAVWEYPAVFGGAACVSTHWIGIYSNQHTELTDAYVRYMGGNVLPPKDHKLYFDYGTRDLDSLYESSQARIDLLLKAAGYDSTNLMTRKYEGHRHHETSWQERLHIPLTFLLGNP